MMSETQKPTGEEPNVEHVDGHRLVTEIGVDVDDTYRYHRCVDCGHEHVTKDSFRMKECE
jgi:hypothetical protein